MRKKRRTTREDLARNQNVNVIDTEQTPEEDVKEAKFVERFTHMIPKTKEAEDFQLEEAIRQSLEEMSAQHDFGYSPNSDIQKTLNLSKSEYEKVLYY